MAEQKELTKISDYLKSFEFKSVLIKIAQKYELQDQLFQFLDVLKKVFKAKNGFESLAYNFQKEFQLDFAKSVDISFDIQQELFKPIQKEISFWQTEFESLQKEDNADFDSELNWVADNLDGEGTKEEKPAIQLWDKKKIEDFFEELLKEVPLAKSPPGLNKRLIKMVEVYWRDLRDEAELKESLQKLVKIGGLGLSDENVDLVIKKIKPLKAEFLENKVYLNQIFKSINETTAMDEPEIDVTAKVVEKPLPAVKTSFIKSGDVTINDLLKEGTGKVFVEEVKKEEEFLESKEELISPPAVAQVAPPPPAVKEEKPVESKMSALSAESVKPIQSKPVLFHQESIASMPAGSSSRPKMEDVKFTPKLFGPIDELANLNLINFRRLSADPAKAVQKIIEKLSLLADDSYEKKVAGVSALKMSPLYALYSNVISRSFDQGKPVAEIITSQDGLSLAEFQSIMDLNKMIKN